MNTSHHKSIGIAVAGLLTALLFGGNLHAETPRPIEFNRDIRPILADNCYACHGPDKGKRKADLRLDTEEGAFADHDGKRPIVPGKPDKSELFRRISAEADEERMPPAKAGRKLSQQQIHLIRQWIEQGGKWQKHWSLMPPVRVQPPAANNKTWPANDIDRFILAKLNSEKVEPSPVADRRTLIRRLSFDLTGLPPTAEEVDAFVNDNSPDAYEKLVDRLLASKHYGERMAIYWLDLVRYADTGGYHSDNHRDVWLYRDYVIAAFNENKSFDKFTIEQLAGDLLPGASNEQKIASGYNRMLMTTEEGGAQPKEYLAKYAADRVRNASSVWLGMTMGCAECHDHKFDPVSSKEFYSFAAYFADLTEKPVGRQDQTPIGTPAQLTHLKQLDEELAAVKKTLESQKPQEEATRKKLADLQKQRDEAGKTTPTTLISISGPPRVMRVLPRGNWLDDSGEIVSPAVPAALVAGVKNGADKADKTDVKQKRAIRLDLANWMISADNPLAARVFVNRLWKVMFGQGLVRSLDDFGTQGTPPTHPELLDWLAVEFRESGWDVKHMLKLMAMSQTYRQSSAVNEEMRHRDPYNHLLARQARYRLEAELVRDNALAISGLLSQRIGGPSVKPYQPAGYWAMLNFPKREWQNDKGENLYRRSLYTYWCRTFLHPSLAAFDAPTREECTVERTRSNTPLQALVLLNDPIYVEAARAFAEKILRDGGKETEQRIQFAYRQALNRKVRAEEVQLLAAIYKRHLKQYSADKAATGGVLAIGDRPIPKDLDAIELAAWTSIGRIILNLHETVTRE